MTTHPAQPAQTGSHAYLTTHQAAHTLGIPPGELHPYMFNGIAPAPYKRKGKLVWLRCEIATLAHLLTPA